MAKLTIIAGIGSSGSGETGGGGGVSGSITSLSASEDITTRVQDGNGNVLTMVDEMIGVSLAGVTGTIWIDRDDGKGPQLQDSYVFSNISNSLTYQVTLPNDSTEVNWVIWAAVGTFTSNTPPAGAVSYAFTVGSVGSVTSSDITTAQFLADPNTGLLINYTPQAGGLSSWLPYAINLTQPTNPAAWFWFITAQKGHLNSGTWVPATDAEGANEAPALYTGRIVYSSESIPEAPGGIISIPGSVFSQIGDYPANSAADRTFRFLLYVVSSKGSSPIGGGAGTIVLQTTGWTGADHFDLTPNSQAATLDGTLLTNASVLANAMGVAAITAANGALAANSVVDNNVVSANVSKLLAGTVIFTGTVYLSMGTANPVMQLDNSGIYLFGVAAAGGGSGLTSSPYVVVQSGGIGLYAGSSAQSMTLQSGSVTLWSVNGSTSNPYLQVQSGGVSAVNGQYSMTVTSALAKIAYSTTIYTSVTATGVLVVSGNYVTRVLGTGITIGYTTATLPTINGAAVSLTNTALTLYAVNGSTSNPYTQVTASGVKSTGGGSTPTSVCVQNGAVYLYSVDGSVSNPYLKMDPNGLQVIAGTYTLKAQASGITLSESVSGNSLLLAAVGITLTSPTSVMQLGSNTNYPNSAVFTSGGYSTVITGNTVACGDLSTATAEITSLTVGGPISGALKIGASLAATTANAGSYGAPPSAVAGYVNVTVGSNAFKMSLYLP